MFAISFIILPSHLWKFHSEA